MLIQAEALSNQATILGWLDRKPEALSALKQAQEIFARAGDRANVASTLLKRGNYKQETDLEILRNALSIYQELGNKAGVARSLQMIARFTELKQSEPRKAAILYQKPLAIYREIGDQEGLQSVLYDMGRVHDILGRTDAAQKYFEECFAINRQMGDKKGILFSQFVLALRDQEKGELKSARKHFTELTPLFREMGDKAMENGMLSHLGWISMLEGDLSESRKHFDQVIGKGKITDTSNVLAPYNYAVLLMEEGNTRQAEELARELVARPRLEAAKPYALQLLAHSLFLQGKRAEAKLVIEQAIPFLSKQIGNDDRAMIEITAARILAGSGKKLDTAYAIKSLKSVAKKMNELGLLFQEYEARLAIGEIEMKSGDVSRGRADLLALQKDAAAKGFGLFSKKTQTLLVP